MTYTPQAGRALRAVLSVSGGIFKASAVLEGLGIPLALDDSSVLAIEYRYRERDTYFHSLDANEIAALDSGAIAGWERTGYSFHVHPQPVGLFDRSVCRFYGKATAGLQSHFFTVFPFECQPLSVAASAGFFESPAIYYAGIPDSVTGECVGGGKPLYRLFNDRPDAAHRWMTGLGPDYFAMILKDWIPEGYGMEGVAFCVAPQVHSLRE